MKKIKFDLEKWSGPLIFSILVILSYHVIQKSPHIWTGVRVFLRVVSPFVWGFVIAYFLNVPCNFMERLLAKSHFRFVSKRSRSFGVLSVYLVFLIVVATAIRFLLPLVTRNVTDILLMVPHYYKNLRLFISNLNVEENPLLESLDLDALFRSFSIQDVITRLSSSFGSIGGYAAALTSSILNLFLGIVSSIYMLLYKESILSYTSRLANAYVKDSSLRTIKEYVGKSNVIFYKFISTQFLDSCIIAVLASIILTILGVKYSVTLAFVLGAANMIPYFGSIFATLLTVTITIFTGGLNLALLAGLSLLVLQQIDGNVIGPKLMGNSLNINPLLIILSITIGGFYFGIVGMFLSVPIAAILKIVANNVLEARERNSSP